MLPIDNYVKPIPPKPAPQPAPKPVQPPAPPTATVTVKATDAQFVGATNRYKLDKQYAATLPTPYNALQQIGSLPQPAPTDTAAVKAYKEQRKQIADDAIANSQPPKLADYRNSGLNGRTAEYEYEQSKQSYDSQIGELKKVSADATRNPAAIISLSKARQEIDSLPRPDRSDPQAILNYNNQRAQIADDALVCAAPPKRADFNGSQTEFQQARAEYNQAVKQLKSDSYAAGLTTPPPINDAESGQAADKYIAAHNGVKNEDDGYGVGKDLAELAKNNPSDAAAIIKQVQTKLNGTAFGDNVVSGLVDSSSDADLQRIATTPGGIELLKDLQHHLLSGDVHDNETDQAKRLADTLTPLTGIFSDGYEGIGPVRANYASPYSENARPEEAASFLKYDTAFSSLGSKGQAFAAALEIHKGDPAWVSDFMREVGKKQVSQYISDSFNGEFVTAKQAASNSTTIRTALETMVTRGDLKQSGMDALVGELKDANPAAFTEIFAKSSNTEFKQMFVQATINTNDPKLEAAGAYVLQTISPTEQGKFLNGLNDAQLNSFVAGAMAGQYQIQDPMARLANPNAAGRDIPQITIGGIDNLTTLAAKETGYNGSTFEKAPFSGALQQRIFLAVNQGLENPTAFDNFKDDQGFKDNLSKIFINHGTEILRAQAPSGSFSGDFIDGMVKFFEMTLFTKNGGGLRDQLMESVIKTMSDVGDASEKLKLNPNLSFEDNKKTSEDQYKKTHNGWTPQSHVEVMGGLQAMVLQAASNQKDYIKDEILNDQQKKQELIGFVTGMAFSFLPGAGEIFGTFAKEGASFLQKIPDKIVSYTFDQAKSQIESESQEGLLNLLKGMNGENSSALGNIDSFIKAFKNTVTTTSSTLPNGDAYELNLRVSFQAAFAFYGSLITF